MVNGVESTANAKSKCERGEPPITRRQEFLRSAALGLTRIPNRTMAPALGTNG